MHIKTMKYHFIIFTYFLFFSYCIGKNSSEYPILLNALLTIMWGNKHSLTKTENKKKKSTIFKGLGEGGKWK